jgi:hypothetical protein
MHIRKNMHKLLVTVPCWMMQAGRQCWKGTWKCRLANTHSHLCTCTCGGWFSAFHRPSSSSCWHCNLFELSAFQTWLPNPSFLPLMFLLHLQLHVFAGQTAITVLKGSWVQQCSEMQCLGYTSCCYTRASSNMSPVHASRPHSSLWWGLWFSYVHVAHLGTWS